MKISEVELTQLVDALKSFAIRVVAESINSSDYGSDYEEEHLKTILREIFQKE